MKIETFILAFLSFLFVITSCEQQSGNVELILQGAETLVGQDPDSVFIMLEKIQSPKSLKKSLFYRYSLLQIQAKDKSYKDITTDTLIFDIQKYYNNEGDIEQAALASFYCGRIRQEQGKHEEALKIYLDAEKYLNQIHNDNLKGLSQSAIGNIYYKQFLKDKAKNHFKLAKDYFHQAGNYNNEISANNFIGNCLLIQKKPDSAFFYYNEALALADSIKVNKLQAVARQNLGVAFRELGSYEQAIYFLRQAMTFSPDSLNNAKLAANLARVYELQDKNDSAVYYLQKALTYLPGGQRSYLTANIYATWSAIAEKDNNYAEALNKYKLYNKYLAQIINDNKNDAILEIEAKYNLQLVENKYKQLLVNRQWMVICFLGVLLLCVLFILWVLRRTEMRRMELTEAEHKIAQMQKMVSRYNKKENSLRNVLIHHFEILKKTALLKSYINEHESKSGKQWLRKFNEVVYGEKDLNWDLLYEVLNNASSGIFEQLRKRLTQLDDSEFRICCLYYVGFNNTEIALILNYRLNTVEVKKSTIRKKLGIESRGNIRDFLNKIIGVR
ncbi:tetratricopeptide repeat protein [Geofilum sp. OHC36d9]|uniref:tetratricopeptide repeat protein n=1 Tax=Geofilum sp. OHC36d9 TaxID=3458413 RepID=UPI00403371E9